MSDLKQTPQNGKVACKVCLKEISISVAKSVEATDYIMHFCGLDCYEKWQEQNKDEDE